MDHDGPVPCDNTTEPWNMMELIQAESPDIAHVHNVFPQLTPSVLNACKRAGVPVVLHCHDYRLTCPVTSHLHDLKVCDRCRGGREYWCALNNCRGDIPESVAYAIRHAVVRAFRLVTDNVTLFVVLSEFAKHHLVNRGFREEQIVVLRNPVLLPESAVDPSGGEYAAFVGRLVPEKGTDTLLAAAAWLPELPIRLAGSGPLMPRLVKSAPGNVTFAGHLNRENLVQFYKKARFLVIPSRWFEMCPLVISEGMSYGLPVVASRIGGLPELVEEHVTGLLFEPGNSEDLASKMELLWKNPQLCRQMGKAGRQKAFLEYSEELYYKRLMAIYAKAIELTKRNKAS